MPDSTTLPKVLDHLRLYDHPLLTFSAREHRDQIEVLINLRPEIANLIPSSIDSYVFTIHPHDLESPQFAWQLQRQLYDSLHDYLIEMFRTTPQDRGAE